MQGSGSLVKVHAENCLVYIGDNCVFCQLNLQVQGVRGNVIIGNGVTSQPTNKWNCSLNAEDSGSTLIVGDDCMFASDVNLKNTDGHLIKNVDTGQTVNNPSGKLVIEPYVWIGQNSTPARFIHKNITWER